MKTNESSAVVITGATAWQFAQHGARIGLIACDEERRQATREEIARLSGTRRITVIASENLACLSYEM